MNSGAARVRRDVRSLLADGDEGAAVLDAYAAAVRTMRALDAAAGDGPPTDPLGWRYQAALHGIAGPDGAPLGDDPLWSSCRHNSWFFLPWHRLYLHRFERIVQQHLDDSTWSLPYWDYADPDDEDVARLPAPFCDPAEDNPLFAVGRNPGVNAGAPVDADLRDARSALLVPDFALPREDPRPTFGGDVVEDVLPNANGRGALEGIPHGSVHVAVGGWMSRFATAALDPIFWLHHCNLDRLWEVWLGLGNANPDRQTWLDTELTFYDVDGSPVHATIASTLDTRALGYVYESTEPPAGMPEPDRIAVPAGPDALAGDLGEEEVLMPSPQLVGAASDVPLAGPTTVSVALEAPERPLGLGADPDAARADERWFLRVENVTGERPEASAYGVYLDVDDPAEEPLRVGTIAAFGIPEASRVDETHDGTGLTDAFDITDAVRALEARGTWDAAAARVTIAPVDAEGRPAPGGDVRAGRISVYRG